VSIGKFTSKMKTKEEHVANLMHLSDKCFWVAIYQRLSFTPVKAWNTKRTPMKNIFSILAIIIISLTSACAPTAQKPTQARESYKAPWSNYSEIAFADAVSFILNGDIQRGNDKEIILDEYLRTLHCDEYKARQKTGYQLEEYRKNYMTVLLNSFSPDKKFIYHLSAKLGVYDPSVSGFRISNVYACYTNKAGTKISQSGASYGMGYFPEDVKFTTLKLKIDNSTFVLPVDPATATKFLSQGAESNTARLVYVYRLSECRRKGSNEIECSIIIDDGYLYPTDYVSESMKPTGQIIKTSTAAKNKGWARAKCISR